MTYLDPTAGYIPATCEMCEREMDIESLDSDNHCPACADLAAKY
jgi:hypothetical protein